MAALLWLLIPVAAGLVASIWGGLAARRRTTTPDADGVAGYERFRAAMERAPSRVAREPAPAATLTGSAPDGPAQEAR